MNPSSSQLWLKSTTSMSLHDRFTFILQNKQQVLSDISGSMPQLQAASVENQRLTQQLAKRHSVMAALQNKLSLKQRLGNKTFMARLGSPAIRGGLHGIARYCGKQRGTSLRRVLPQRGMKRQVSGLADYRSLIQQQRMGRISRGALTHNRGVTKAMRGRGFGWAGRKGRADCRPQLTREELDKELDDYMSMSKSHLDAQLDAYMAEVDPEGLL